VEQEAEGGAEVGRVSGGEGQVVLGGCEVCWKGGGASLRAVEKRVMSLRIGVEKRETGRTVSMEI
jgi:hypothetical protein